MRKKYWWQAEPVCSSEAVTSCKTTQDVRTLQVFVIVIVIGFVIVTSCKTTRDVRTLQVFVIVIVIGIVIVTSCKTTQDVRTLQIKICSIIGDYGVRVQSSPGFWEPGEQEHKGELGRPRNYKHHIQHQHLFWRPHCRLEEASVPC